MIEIVLLNYLGTRLGIPVYMEIPADRDEKFVVLKRAGSAKENGLLSATFALNSYASSLYEAAQLNEEVKNAMEETVDLNDVSACSLSTDYIFTDTDAKHYCYQAVFTMTHY